jgi:hypothetical protein
MRGNSKKAITSQKMLHMARRSQEENPDNMGVHSEINSYNEMINDALEPVDCEIVAGECLPDLYERGDSEIWTATDTLLNPNSIHQTASLDRLTLADESGHGELCIDAADTIGAENSLEKMLAHQMAICHAEGMKLVVKAGEMDDDAVSLKMLHAATRFMEVYQKGFEAIHRVKRGNRQTVVVKYQQVNVSDGGQAVISEAPGGGYKNGRRG